MKKAINELPSRLEAGGVCFNGQDWGDINVARVRFPAGADAAPLLEGLPNNLCQCPHWGSPSDQMGALMNHLEAKLKG
jgi:hypothetical protein